MESATSAVAMLRGFSGQSLASLTAAEVIIEADAPEVPVGIDGEAVTVPTPVCTIRPRALRAVLPRNRPGVPAARTRIEWDRLWRAAFGRTADPGS